MTSPITSSAGVFVPVPGGRVIVGYDGSLLAVAALDWAAREAAARYAPLRIVAAAIPSDAADFYNVGARRRTELADAAATIASRSPQLQIEQFVTVLDPTDALLGDATIEDLVVVGASRGSTAKRVLLGSVSRAAARRSLGPVVIVHDQPRRSTIESIGVGVDGSPAAAAAIEWACSESRFHGADIEVIHACDNDDRGDPDQIVEHAVNRCRTLTPNPVRSTVTAGTARDVLVAASHHADLIAIGSRGRSGLKTALFGSVALAVASRAQCPTAVTHSAS